MKPLRLACCLLALVSSGWATAPSPNATFVCQIYEGRLEAASVPTEKSPPLRGLRCVTTQSGVRCISSGVTGKLEVEPVIGPDEKKVDANYTITNGEQQIVTTLNGGLLGQFSFLGANESGGKRPSEYVYVLPLLQRTALPASFPDTGQDVHLRLEIIEGDLDASQALLHQGNSWVDAATVIRELSAAVENGKATSRRFPLPAIKNGRSAKPALDGIAFLVEPLVGDGDLLSVNYRLETNKNVLTSSVLLKNGDSLFLGTLESEKPGKVQFVLLHTSSQP